MLRASPLLLAFFLVAGCLSALMPTAFANPKCDATTLAGGQYSSGVVQNTCTSKLTSTQSSGGSSDSYLADSSDSLVRDFGGRRIQMKFLVSHRLDDDSFTVMHVTPEEGTC